MTISGDHKLISTIESPDEDFEPMPEGDKQRRNLSYTTEALRLWFEQQPNVYVSGNLFIRYVEARIEKRIAPDTFVVFGMSNDDRVSYRVWDEGNKAPDFVLEVTSKGTVTKDREQNPLIYQALGVKEYFQYDPTGEYLKPNSLQGVRLEQGKYVAIPTSMLSDNVLSLPSQVLGLDLHLYPDRGFRFYDRVTNQVLRSYAEAERSRFQSELERSFEQQARIEAESIAERQKLIAQQERLAKQQAEQGQKQAEQKAQRLAKKLRSMGIDPDRI